MQIADEYKVPVNYDEYTEPIKTQRPTVYPDGDAFCCISGPDPQSGVFGSGKNAEQALSSWEDAWQRKYGQP